MRYFILNGLNTWDVWQLTLTGKDVSPPKPKTNYIDLPGRDGTLDLSEALTGEVAYTDRTVKAKFWTSEGTEDDRVWRIRSLINALHGRKVRIVEPDDLDHYFVGRVSIKHDVHDQVHDELTLEAVCEPWRYALAETTRKVEVNGGSKDFLIHNAGAKPVCPTIEVEGSVTLTYDGVTVELTTGSHKSPNIKLHFGTHTVGVSGTGSVTFIYREAKL